MNNFENLYESTINNKNKINNQFNNIYKLLEDFKYYIDSKSKFIKDISQYENFKDEVKELNELYNNLYSLIEDMQLQVNH